RAPVAPSSHVLQEVARELGPDRRQHGLRVELHAVDWQLAVADAHYLTVAAGRRHLPHVGNARRSQGVIAARLGLGGPAGGARAGGARPPRLSRATALACRAPSRFAWPISPPNASTIAWWPRQTPSVGVVGASRRTISSVAPGPRGLPGAGG